MLKTQNENKILFGQRLKVVLEMNSSSPEDLAARLHVPIASVESWIEGTTYPDADVLVSICILYNVSSDFLMGFTEYKELRQTKCS